MTGIGGDELAPDGEARGVGQRLGGDDLAKLLDDACEHALHSLVAFVCRWAEQAGDDCYSHARTQGNDAGS
ncbi:hypothetical protein GCM10027088_04600 [Nocardia goodfellowii]